jgi:hypothetical protein
MRDEIDDLVERRISVPGTTREDIRKELLPLDTKWSHRKTKTRDEVRVQMHMVGRSGRLLHCFHHGVVGGNATPEDDRLIDRIRGLPRRSEIKER